MDITIVNKEILTKIATLLGPEDKARASRTCRLWHQVMSQERLWKEHATELHRKLTGTPHINTNSYRLAYGHMRKALPSIRRDLRRGNYRVSFNPTTPPSTDPLTQRIGMFLGEPIYKTTPEPVDRDMEWLYHPDIPPMQYSIQHAARLGSMRPISIYSSELCDALSTHPNRFYLAGVRNGLEVFLVSGPEEGTRAERLMKPNISCSDLISLKLFKEGKDVHLLTLDEMGTIQMWDVDTGDLISKFSIAPHIEVFLLPYRNSFAVGAIKGKNETLGETIWDLYGKKIFDISLPAHTTPQVSFKDGSHILTTIADQTWTAHRIYLKDGKFTHASQPLGEEILLVTKFVSTKGESLVVCPKAKAMEFYDKTLRREFKLPEKPFPHRTTQTLSLPIEIGDETFFFSTSYTTRFPRLHSSNGKEITKIKNYVRGNPILNFSTTFGQDDKLHIWCYSFQDRLEQEITFGGRQRRLLPPPAKRRKLTETNEQS